MNRTLRIAMALLFCLAGKSSAQDTSFMAKIKPFLDAHCVDCHGPEVKKAGLRLDTLKPDFADSRMAALWMKVHDKLAEGQMPPPKRPRPPQGDLRQTMQWLNQQLHAQSRARQEKEGRVVLRRLNGTEYENTLRDLFGLNVSVKSLLPQDNVAAGFDNISAALEISAGHLLAYQQAAEKAIFAAIPYAPQMPFSDKRTGKQIVEKSPPFNSATGQYPYLQGDSLTLHARLPDHDSIVATALSPQKGRYKITTSAYAVGTQGKPLTLAILCRPVRERGAPEIRVCFNVPPAIPLPPAGEGRGRGTIFEAEFEMNRECHAWVAPWTLPERYDFFLKKVDNIQTYPGPGLVVEWIKMEGPIGDWPPESYQRLFKDVPLKARSVAKAEAEKRTPPKIPANRPESFWQNYDPLVPASLKPKEDAERLIRDFLPRALRRPVSEELKKHYVKLVHDRLDDKYSFLDAMVFGYKAILTSADFLFLAEPGTPKLTDKKDFQSTRLDDHAVANRLSYFLWSSLPDAELLRAADKGLSKPASLRAQVDRMLNDPKAHRFTENFTGQWLDLRKLNDTTPDPKLYPEYDQFLNWSMPRETELYFEEILKQDRSLLEFVDSDWSILNERLAQHYGIAGVIGQEMRKVKLPAGTHRGGVM